MTTDITLTPYQTELARLLAKSTLTPATYQPTEEIKTAHHAAVFVDGQPVILCGLSDDKESVDMAKALAGNPDMKRAFRACGYAAKEVGHGSCAGKLIQWKGTEAAISSKPSGQVEHGGSTGDLHAIVLDHPRGLLDSRAKASKTEAMTVFMCINTSVARCLDKNAPELDNGERLAILSRQPSEKIVGRENLSAMDFVKAARTYAASIPIPESRNSFFQHLDVVCRQFGITTKEKVLPAEMER